MPILVLIILLGALLAGALILVVGVRGRRINRDPVCRDCDFNLSGVVPAGVTCPECGAGLKRRGAVRIGQRRRMPVVIGLGGLVALAAVLPLAAAGLAAATGTNVDTYKPVNVLLWELRRANATRSGTIADELLNRMLTGAMPEEEERRIVEVVLGIQRDPQRPWSETLGDLIDRARLDSRITDEQMDQFRRYAAVFDIQVRPRVRAGDVLPVAVRLKETRVSASTSVQVMVHLTGAQVGETPLRPERPVNDVGDFFMGRMDRSMVMFMISGSKSQFRWGRSGDQVVCLGQVPESVTPGTATLTVRLIPVAIDMGAMRGLTAWPDTDELKDKPGFGFEKTLTVVGTDGSTLERVSADEATASALAEKLRPSMTHAYSYDEDNPPMVQMQFETADLPVPLAHEVFVRSGQRRWKLGVVTSGVADAGRMSMGQEGASQRHVVNQLREFDLDKVDLVFKPKPELALRTLEQTRAYDGEFVVEGVTVEWPQGKSAATKGKSGTGSFWRMLLGK